MSEMKINSDSYPYRIVYFFIYSIIFLRAYNVYKYGGFLDRSVFFGGEVLSNNILDMILNEILVFFVLFRILIERVSTRDVVICLAISILYFTRAPLLMMIFALMWNPYFKIKIKVLTIATLSIFSFFILYLRLGNELFEPNNINLFISKYALVGVGRLLVTEQNVNIPFIHMFTFLIKPLDAVLFCLDNFFSLSGQISSGRFSGKELSEFVYVPILEDNYNAFGTILYPFFLIYGDYFGCIFFVFFMIINYYFMSAITRNKKDVKLFMLYSLSSGVIFSWTSPFYWLMPYIVIKIRNRNVK